MYFRLSTEELETRVTNLDILPTLKSQPQEFCKRLQTYIYPTLEGRDHARLLYYYTILTGCDIVLEGGLTADAHVKLLKRVKTVMPGEKDLSDFSAYGGLRSTLQLTLVVSKSKFIPNY